MKAFIKKNQDGLFQTLRELCAIPAPSGAEKARATYCKQWLEKIGATGVYTDQACNVILPINCEKSNCITVFAAHMDTVFPDTEAMPYTDDGIYIRSPGVGDNTASLAILLYVAKYFIEKNIHPAGGVLFVCNSCEEGLGNLLGVKQLFKDYEGRIARFITFDSQFESIVDTCVGSHRYEVEVLTEGGHSYAAFGNRNAIAELAKIVTAVYATEIPHMENSKTTYNIGNICGGTSVNTIAQSAKMLCEYRSDREECLAAMKTRFHQIFDEAKAQGVNIGVSLIGERPCMGHVDPQEIRRLYELCRNTIEDIACVKVRGQSGSTDCNIPLSLGVPALCIGVYNGGGSHTREEWVEKASLPLGLEIGIKVSLDISHLSV